MDYRQIAKSHLPKGYRLRETRRKTTALEDFESYTGLIASIDYSRKVIYVPRIDSPAALFLYFHELGHHWMKDQRRQQPQHQREYQAEQFARGAMRVYGIPVPRNLVRSGKEYIRDCIIADEKVGHAVFAPARKYALT